MCHHSPPITTSHNSLTPTLTHYPISGSTSVRCCPSPLSLTHLPLPRSPLSYQPLPSTLSQVLRAFAAARVPCVSIGRTGSRQGGLTSPSPSPAGGGSGGSRVRGVGGAGAAEEVARVTVRVGEVSGGIIFLYFILFRDMMRCDDRPQGLSTAHIYYFLFKQLTNLLIDQPTNQPTNQLTNLMDVSLGGGIAGRVIGRAAGCVGEHLLRPRGAPVRPRLRAAGALLPPHPPRTLVPPLLRLQRNHLQ